MKSIDFPASVTSTDTGYGELFYGVSLDCFSFAGTTDFSSITKIFHSVATIYVSTSYQP